MTTSLPRAGVGRLLLVGAVAGLLSGMLGVGGGIIMVPLLVGVLGFDQHRAHATSLAAIILIAVAGSLRFGLAGEIVIPVGLALGVGGLVGSTLGAHLMHRLSPTALKAVFGVVMILAGARMVLGGDPGPGQPAADVVGALIGVAIGLVAGVASGVAGIGGGVVMVPAMIFFLGVDQHAAEGSSLLAILFTAVAGTRVNVSHGRVAVGQATVIGLGGVLSALAGASLALYISGSTLTRLFGAFVTAVGVRMLVRLTPSRRVPTP